MIEQSAEVIDLAVDPNRHRRFRQPRIPTPAAPGRRCLSYGAQHVAPPAVRPLRVSRLGPVRWVRRSPRRARLRAGRGTARRLEGWRGWGRIRRRRAVGRSRSRRRRIALRCRLAGGPAWRQIWTDLGLANRRLCPRVHRRGGCWRPPGRYPRHWRCHCMEHQPVGLHVRHCRYGALCRTRVAPRRDPCRRVSGKRPLPARWRHLRSCEGPGCSSPFGVAGEPSCVRAAR